MADSFKNFYCCKADEKKTKSAIKTEIPREMRRVTPDQSICHRSLANVTNCTF